MLIQTSEMKKYILAKNGMLSIYDCLFRSCTCILTMDLRSTKSLVDKITLSIYESDRFI